MPIKLGDIIRYTGLDPSTARYVVSSPLIKDIPYAGKQGRHRLFEMTAAMKVALATWLAMTGCSLEDANWLCDTSLRIVRDKTSTRRDVIFSTTTTAANPWVLELAHQRFFRVYKQGGNASRKFQRIRPEPGESDAAETLPLILAWQRFDLTLMEMRLMQSQPEE